jgi:general L-amino acid transport system permease protein
MSMARDLAFVREKFLEPAPPPGRFVGPVAWMQTNLFSSPLNSIATIVASVFVFWVVWSSLDWLIFDATFEGASREACLASGEGNAPGACWAFVKAKFGQFIYGRYPIDERWRVNIVYFLFAALLVPMAIPRVPFKLANGLLLLVAFPIVALVLLTGGNFDFSASTNLILIGVLAAVLVFSLLTSGMAETGNLLFRVAVFVLAAGVALGIIATILSFVPGAESWAVVGIVSVPGVGFLGRLLPLGSVALGIAGALSIVTSIVSLVANWLDPNARRVSIAGVVGPAAGSF